MMPVMLKTSFSLRVDGKLLAEAQRLVDAGEFDSLADMVESALRDYLQSFDAAPSDDVLDALVGSGVLDGDVQCSLPAHEGAAGATPTVTLAPEAPGGTRPSPSADFAEGIAASAPLGPARSPLPAGSLDARVLRGLTEAFGQVDRDGYERLVISYSALAQHPLQDGEMRELAEIFQTYGLQESLNALDEAQNSRLPLSPSYLETLLQKRKPPTTGAAPRSADSFGRLSDGPERVFADFDNPLAAAVAELYEKEIGLLTERVRDQIRTYTVEFPDLARWHEAFGAAAGMNKRSLRYVLGVLRGNAAKVVEQKGRDKGGLSKSERHREAKRSRNKDYKEYWDAKLKARQDPRSER